MRGQISSRKLLGWSGWPALALILVLGNLVFAADSPDTRTSDTLQIGDVVKITLSGPPDMDSELPAEQKVKENGTVSLKYIGSVKAVGLTAGQLEKAIHDAYVPKFYKHISVVVVADNQFFYVSGEVKNPNRHPHVSELTVTKAIASAGGFTDFAKRSKVTITRLAGKQETIDCDKVLKDPTLDLPVYPGDKIHVPRRWW